MWNGFVYKESFPSNTLLLLKGIAFTKTKDFHLKQWFLLNEMAFTKTDVFHPNCVKSIRIRNSSWSVFSRIRTEYGQIQSISMYSVRMQKNADCCGVRPNYSREGKPRFRETHEERDVTFVKRHASNIRKY